MSETVRLPRTALMLALGRVIIAAFLFYFATTDNGAFNLEPEGDDVATFSYLLAATAIYLACRTGWKADFTVNQFSFSFDYLALILIPRGIDPAGAGFFVGSTLIAALIILNATTHFGFRASRISAVLTNLVCYAVCLLPHALGLHADMDMTFTLLEDLRHLAFLTLATGALIALIGSIRFEMFVHWPGVRPEENLAAQIDALCSVLVPRLGATRAFLTWHGNGGGSCVCRAFDADGGGHAVNATCGLRQGNQARPMIFDAVSGFAIELTADAHVVRTSASAADDREVQASGFTEGLAIPFRGLSGSGRLILAGLPALRRDYFRMCASLEQYLSQQFDRSELLQLIRRQEAVRTRDSVARDLHDSVAQSIAGAAYWLRGLAISPRMPEDAKGDIGETVAALETEGRQIRAMIDRLRAEEPAPTSLSLADLLGPELATLELNWRIRIAMEDDSGALVNPDTAHDIQQILREAVSNAVRHGGATGIAIRIERVDGELRIAIADNGSGFPCQDTTRLPRSIADRVVALHGNLGVASAASGATLTITLPEALVQ